MATDDPRAQNFDPFARSPMAVSNHDAQKDEFRSILEYLLYESSFFMDRGDYGRVMEDRIKAALKLQSG